MVNNLSSNIQSDHPCIRETFELNYDYIKVVEKSKQKVFLVTASGAFIFASSEITNRFGYSTAEYHQLNIFQIIHQQDLMIARAKIKESLEQPGKTICYRWRNLDNKGIYHWVEGQLINLINDKEVCCLIFQFHDIDKLVLQIEQQSDQIEELQQKNLDLNQFSYIVSHNLKSPLSNLAGLIAILDEDQLDEHNKKIIELIHSSTKRLNETIFDLAQILNLKKKQKVQISSIDVKEVMDKVRSSFKSQTADLPIKYNLYYACRHVEFNNSYLESILMNLYSNAIKYRSPEKTLEISLALRLTDEGRHILTFGDNGSGMDPDVIEGKIFGLHNRFHPDIKGNGVGLYITQAQIKSLGGTIEVTSRIGEGTQFTITFPDARERIKLN